jgi:hypothetical protein
MVVMKNMDELMDIDIPNDWIAATHVCACNPRKFAHYPADWQVGFIFMTKLCKKVTGLAGFLKTVLTHLWVIRRDTE